MMVLRAFAALLVAAGVPVPRELRAGGVEFLDPRPVVIDLAAAPAGQQWQVPIVDGLAGAGHRFTLRVAFRPAGVIKVVKPVVTSAQGDVPAFVIGLDSRREGSGELVVAGGGVVVRRQISTTYRRPERTVPIGSVQFAGVRLAPFADQVRIGRVHLPGAPGGGAAEVGVLTSARGDTATVVRVGDEFVVRDAGGVGQYEGALDLLPDQPGTEATATLRLRDVPAWPFLVLLLGLALVQVLDRYQARLRPRRLLDLRVARLRDRARALESRTGRALRICGEPGLLLDQRVAEALGAADESRTEAEWAAWDSDGAEYQKLAGVVDAFRAVVEAYQGLRAEAAADDMIAPADREPARRALAAGPVGEALAGRRVRTADDLTDAAERLTAARAYLREFRQLYRTLAMLRSAGTPAEAARLLAKLYAAPGDLAGLAEEVDELYRGWQPSAPPLGSPVLPGGPEVRVPSPPVGLRPAAPPGRRLAPVAAAAALILCVPVAVLSFLAVNDENRDAGPAATATTKPSPSGTGGPREIPEAPVAVPPSADPGIGDTPGTGEVVWYTAVLPLLLAGTMAAAAWWVVAWWRRRGRGTRRLDELDTAAIDREVRTEGLRFAVASGVLVVLSGMSVLYVGNPTFGTAGDYLAVALWGTALGEGVQLARRLWPTPRV